MMSSREHSLSALSTGHALLKGELGVSLTDNILSIIWSDGTSHRNSTFVLTKEDRDLCVIFTSTSRKFNYTVFVVQFRGFSPDSFPQDLVKLNFVKSCAFI